MRFLGYLASVVLAGVVVGSALAAAPSAGELSVEGGRGTVVLDIRGSVLGRLAAGTVRVIDLTPRDRFEPLVTGRRLTQDQVGLRAVVYRGQGLRFRMLGGRYRIVARGSGISISAVGRGAVTLVANRLEPGDDAGVYSVDGSDCGLEPELCDPLPDEPERHLLGPRDEEGGTTP